MRYSSTICRNHVWLCHTADTRISIISFFYDNFFFLFLSFAITHLGKALPLHVVMSSVLCAIVQKLCCLSLIVLNLAVPLLVVFTFSCLLDVSVSELHTFFHSYLLKGHKEILNVNCEHWTVSLSQSWSHQCSHIFFVMLLEIPTEF